MENFLDLGIGQNKRQKFRKMGLGCGRKMGLRCVRKCYKFLISIDSFLCKEYYIEYF